MSALKSWILFPFQASGKRRSSRYHADKPDDSPPQSRGNPFTRENTNAGSLFNNNAFAAELERSHTHEDYSKKNEEDIVHDYNAPTHMWVIATLFPLIAGTFGPMASMFNICAITINWRILVVPTVGSEEAGGHYINDPNWLVGVNAVSLVIAIVANLSLLGQMTNRIRYSISGPITIVGFFISGLVDIALVSAAPTYVPLPPNKPNATWSQAFYYASFSGAIYVVLAIMLSVTAYGIFIGHYSNEFKLSMSQRSLMLQTMMFLGYILAAGAVYARIENWDYLNATYFIVVTLFTIGFGDLVPKTHLGRSLFFPMAIGGILYVGVIVANIRALVLESGSVKVSTRLVEKARLAAIKHGNPEDGTVKLRGVRRRSITGENELERRRKEFEIMRDIQKEAHQNNRVFALGFATLAFCILWFIGAVVFWQAEMSEDGQHWTYFESIYFTFVAQLTIGYGDFEPQTNSAKPAFVFWALIALPTLTVLIGAVGDSISDFVNWYTVWIGNHAKDIMRWIRSARGDNGESTKEAKKRIERELDEAEKGFTKIADIHHHSIIPRGLETQDLSKHEAEIAEMAYRPLMLLRAANKVVEHLDDDPPKRYSFDEWCWLLKLLGEDEASEQGHRLVGRPLDEGAQVASPLRTADHQVWSWMGQESPLMSLEDDIEAKWVLRRLMRVLEHDLKARSERRIRERLGKQLSEDTHHHHHKHEQTQNNTDSEESNKESVTSHEKKEGAEEISA